MSGRLLNERLKQIRKIVNLNQKQFSEKISLKQGSLSDIERGRIGVSSKVAEAVCKKFKVNAVWLHTGKGEMFTDKNYILQGKNTGDNTGDSKRSETYDFDLIRNLKIERADLDELFDLISYLKKEDLNRFYWKYLKSAFDFEDNEELKEALNKARNYSEYKKLAFAHLDAYTKYVEAIRPVAKAIREFLERPEIKKLRLDQEDQN